MSNEVSCMPHGPPSRPGWCHLGSRWHLLVLSGRHIFLGRSHHRQHYRNSGEIALEATSLDIAWNTSIKGNPASPFCPGDPLCHLVRLALSLLDVMAHGSLPSHPAVRPANIAPSSMPCKQRSKSLKPPSPFPSSSSLLSTGRAQPQHRHACMGR